MQRVPDQLNRRDKERLKGAVIKESAFYLPKNVTDNAINLLANHPEYFSAPTKVAVTNATRTGIALGAAKMNPNFGREVLFEIAFILFYLKYRRFLPFFGTYPESEYSLTYICAEDPDDLLLIRKNMSIKDVVRRHYSDEAWEELVRNMGLQQVNPEHLRNLRQFFTQTMTNIVREVDNEAAKTLNYSAATILERIAGFSKIIFAADVNLSKKLISVGDIASDIERLTEYEVEGDFLEDENEDIADEDPPAEGNEVLVPIIHPAEATLDQYTNLIKAKVTDLHEVLRTKIPNLPVGEGRRLDQSQSTYDYMWYFHNDLLSKLKGCISVPNAPGIEIYQNLPGFVGTMTDYMRRYTKAPLDELVEVTGLTKDACLMRMCLKMRYNYRQARQTMAYETNLSFNTYLTRINVLLRRNPSYDLFVQTLTAAHRENLDHVPAPGVPREFYYRHVFVWRYFVDVPPENEGVERPMGWPELGGPLVPVIQNIVGVQQGLELAPEQIDIPDAQNGFLAQPGPPPPPPPLHLQLPQQGVGELMEEENLPVEAGHQVQNNLPQLAQQPALNGQGGWADEGQNLLEGADDEELDQANN